MGILREGMELWRQSLKYNPWNWYPLKDLVSAYLEAATEFNDSGRKDEASQVVTSAQDYANRLLKVTPYRPATYYYTGQLEILAGKMKNDQSLKDHGLQKLLFSIQLDPINIPSYYLTIAQYYYDEGQKDEAMNYLAQLETTFVPTLDGAVDFGALRGKSLARQDWVDITETVRQAWQLKATILLDEGKTDDALVALYNGLNTPLGGGEMIESHYDLGQLQLPFLIKIADIKSQQGDWLEARNRAQQAVDILTKRDELGTADSRHIYEILYAAKSHLAESGS